MESPSQPRGQDWRSCSNAETARLGVFAASGSLPFDCSRFPTAESGFMRNIGKTFHAGRSKLAQESIGFSKYGKF